MAALAILASAIIAVSSWFVTQHQARQAVRRNMRIDYLLDAYRRMERASNRPMTNSSARAIEEAVADVQLLGSPDQVHLANAFATPFAAKGEAVIAPLLEDLRTSLRDELLLEKVQPNWKRLRISMEGGAVPEHSRIWLGEDQVPRQAIQNELGGERLPVDFGEDFPAQMRELAISASPVAAIEVSIQRVEHDLRSLMESAGEDVPGLNVSQLASRALELGLIDVQLADAINGLGVMRLMSVMNQTRLGIDEAMEFVGLAAGVLYVLSRPRGPRRQL